jgi:type IV pilus assembly protein PilM
VRFQAQDQVPMPLSNAVLDFHALGIVETPEGPRQRVVLVAAQRDMIQRLLAAVRDAGLRPEGIDLSAFALIRSLYRPDPEHSGRVLYLNVDGLTNMAIAEGTLCRFTRVVGGGIEAMASQLAERRSIPLVEARELLAAADLTLRPEPEPIAQSVVAEAEAELEEDLDPHGAVDPEAPTAVVDEVAPADAVASVEEQDARERDMSFAEMAGVGKPAVVPEPVIAAPTDAPPASVPAPALSSQTPDADVRTVLENGIREIAGEVRNSLDFHRSQEGGGEVARVVLSGAALDLPGFAEALQEQLGIQVERESVHSDEQQLGGISAHRLAIAAGLAVEEAPR